VDGFLIWQFRLEALHALPEVQTTTDEAREYSGNGPAQRKLVTTQRMVRSTTVTRTVKAWHGGCCQVCHTTLQVPGGTHSEGAHIQPARRSGPHSERPLPLLELPRALRRGRHSDR
jgi:putative restriction endonuclease